jgi:hypothetical protein
MQTFVLPADNAAARQRIAANLSEFVALLPAGKTWQVEIKQQVRRRSLGANSYLWAALYAPLVQQVGFTPADWHEYFLGNFFGWRDEVKPGGRVEQVPKRSTTKNERGEPDVLSAGDFEQFLLFIQVEAAQQGVFVDVSEAVAA